MTAVLRCHLLIGAPASGKSSIAAQLAPLLKAEILSTDAIREELYGDPSVQGRWPEVEEQLHSAIEAHVAAGRSVLIDATHARRPWRLAITQRLALSQPVEWIGWWLQTPLDTCLAWNARRPRSVPDAVVQQSIAALNDPVFGPDRSEGFAAVVDIDPAAATNAGEMLTQAIAALERRIRAARTRDRAKQLHGYSRLLDLERLLHLLQLLSRFPGLRAGDVATRSELETICTQLPEGSMAERAAALLSRLHGSCYGEVDALERDLLWLNQQGFLNAERSTRPLEPPPAPDDLLRWNRGGWSPLADRTVFVRVFSLLRHLLHHPFDREPGVPLPAHLIEALGWIYLPSEAATLRKDVERVLTPYGFRSRNDNVRHGYGLGMAVLPAARLREVHQVVSQAALRLEDPTALDLLAELDERLRWAGVLRNDELPLRAFANRSIVHRERVRRDALAMPAQAERLEAAITQGQRVLLERFSDAASFKNAPEPLQRVWPLQLLFHNIGWYLAYEEDAVGHEHGLIRTERLDRLALRQVDSSRQRCPRQRAVGIRRLTRLLEISGGIHFGENRSLQLAIAGASAAQLPGLLTTVRFRCTELIYRFLREGLQRYPQQQMRLPLEPNQNDSHPYPVEIDLPPWTVERDVDFRRWLFGYGAEVVIESPAALRQEHQRRAEAVAALYRN